uniref:IRG-type G domain-containing protein n=1 Tax=Pseudonaja textilis TaxID=8673 RepID=A0A670ZGK8_PSETE
MVRRFESTVFLGSSPALTFTGPDKAEKHPNLSFPFQIICTEQRATMGNEMTRDFLRRQFEKFQRNLSQGSIHELADNYQKHLNEMQNLPLNIAVTGQAGAGKSSFVNAFRGVMDDDDEAAEVGTVKGTMVPKAYPHPSCPNIQIWDLPRFGTPMFKEAEYVQKVQFERYDVFIMVTADGFTKNDALLAKEIHKTGKKFYYVRSKIDISIEGEMRKKNFNMEKTLACIRRYSEDNLRMAGGPSARVFLISNGKADKYRYDFPLLRETMAAELPYYKKHISTMAAQFFSESELMMKKAEITSYIKKVALVSCACGVVPVPGLSMLCDIPILLDALKCICNAFGFDANSLRFLAIHTGKGFEELRSAVKKTPLANTINIGLVFSLLMTSSFAVTYHFLNTFLDDVMEDKHPNLSFPFQIICTEQRATMGNEITRDFIWREFEEFRRDLSQGSIHELADNYQKHLNEMQNLPLNIAVTGQAGAGKSSFVNAFRGVMDGDDEAAETGAVEGTKEPKAYPHPSCPNILIWDFPGIGTPMFKEAEYVQKVQFERYDVFIMVTADRFTENDALLAKEIHKMGKKFYYVRSKIDISIEGEMRKKNFNMEKTLACIRDYCENSLRKAGGPSARVFLISNWKADKYDFPLLQETIIAELPNYQKQILTLAVHLFSENELMKKKELMKSYIKKVALVSCVCGMVRVPGLSMFCEIGILLDALKRICNAFGLDEQTLHFLALQTGKEYEELRSAIKKTPLVSTINKELVFSLLKKSALWVNVSIVEIAFTFIPVIGSVFGGASSYAITYYFLNSFLDDAMEDAQNVRAKLLE